MAVLTDGKALALGIGERGCVLGIERRAWHGLRGVPKGDAGKLGSLVVIVLPAIVESLGIEVLLRLCLRLGVGERERIITCTSKLLSAKAVHHISGALLRTAAIHLWDVVLEDVVPRGVDVVLVLELEGLRGDDVVCLGPVYVQKLGMRRVRGVRRMLRHDVLSGSL